MQSLSLHFISVSAQESGFLYKSHVSATPVTSFFKFAEVMQGGHACPTNLGRSTSSLLSEGMVMAIGGMNGSVAKFGLNATTPTTMLIYFGQSLYVRDLNVIIGLKGKRLATKILLPL